MTGPAAAPLDLRGTPCPLNFVRTRLALERLAAGERLVVWLDAGEPDRQVAEGIAAAGHGVERQATSDGAVQLTITRA
ncbi:MAG: sulfurtransferase TusA family protein [Synechococcus sp.]|jgi:TusA-related sulfurtransferase|nr:sulfurtransferase TusA family protein [Synechococcus sp. Tobar2m-G35]